MPAPADVRVVVKLPYNRPENAPNDPAKIEWTPEKADILWKVIERSRSVDSAGADWKGLAAHLEVPLPYLLYRVNARFQEEIRGLKDIQGALSPTANTTAPKTLDFPLSPQGERPPTNLATRMIGSDKLATSRQGTPLGVRARLTSLGKDSTPRPKKAISSSTLTLQAIKRPFEPMRPYSPSTSEHDTDSSDEEALKEEEAERNAEEEESLARKLEQLQRMMTNDALGLVSGTRPKGKAKDRGRSAPMSPRSVGSYRNDNLSSASISGRSHSQSLSSAGSPQGSIPEIPSPSSEPQSPPRGSRTNLARNLSAKAGSPPAVSGRNALGQMQMQRRYGPLVDRTSDFGSSHGSEASSFSDLSDASLSSALEDAFMSNFGGSNASHASHNSHTSHFNSQRSRAANRNHAFVPQ